jgi:prevent-host-death family protein
VTSKPGHEVIAMEINAAQFKAKCPKLLDQVAATHEPLVITRRGRRVAKLAPIEDEARAPLFGYMKGTGQILGDIVDVTREPWAAETGGGEEDDCYATPPADEGKS